MADRKHLAQTFLERAGWGGAKRVPLAGDASQRSYERLIAGDARAVLMDAPPDSGEDVAPFLHIARHLDRLGFSAPKILAQDVGHGFLLLEDFGDALFPAAIRAEPGVEDALYRAAVDVLVALQSQHLPDGIPAFTPQVMAEQAALVFDCYGGDMLRKHAFQAELETVLHNTLIGGPVLILRDYHAENLIWLPDRQGVRRVGLLDFQDALAGPVGYDLVSLLMDVRRDVPKSVAEAMIAHFLARTGVEPERFTACRAALGAQRNLRILGVFARLARLRGKTGYIDLIPRVWGHLMRSLEHPELAGLAEIIGQGLPKPTPQHLERLRAR